MADKANVVVEDEAEKSQEDGDAVALDAGSLGSADVQQGTSVEDAELGSCRGCKLHFRWILLLEVGYVWIFHNVGA